MNKIKSLGVFFLVISACLYSQTWSPLGSGTDYSVNAFTVFNNDLIAGGDFQTAGGDTVYGIAKWNGSSWSPLGPGMAGSNPYVYALTIYNNELIAGGDFVWAGNNWAYHIAKWNGIAWTPLGAGVNYNAVYSLAVYNNDLYAGGYFTLAGGDSARNIAKWNGSQWAPLGSGTNGFVNALLVYNNELIVGGAFNTAGGYTNTGGVAKWNGTSWSRLNGGLGIVNALTVYNSNLIAGGAFGPFNVAQWDGNNWYDLDPYGYPILNNRVNALAVYNDDLIVGGDFTEAEGNIVNYITKWNGSHYLQMNGGMNAMVYALSVYNSNLIAGGYFDVAGGNPASHIAKLIDITEIKLISSEIPKSFSLAQNYPNPFNPSTNIKFDISRTSAVKLAVYNVLGQEVAVLVNEELKDGSYNYAWDAANFASGVYYYKLTAGDYSDTKKMVLVK